MKKKVATQKAKKQDSHTEEIKRYLGVLSEDFHGRVSGIAEQFGGLNKKLDSHTQMIGQLMVDMQEVKNGIKVKVDHVDFARLDKRVVLIENRLHGVKTK